MMDDTTPLSRLEADLPLLDPEDAAATLSADATILFSGFGSVGYPKRIPEVIAADGDAYDLTIVHSGKVGDEIDRRLIESGAVSRRFSYQSSPIARELTHSRTVAFSDRNASSISDAVQYGGLVEPDVAIVEAVAVGEGWFIPPMSIGTVPGFVEAAPRLLIELNHAVPIALAELHDIYRPGPPPHRDPIPLASAGDRIGGSKVRFDPSKLIGVVESDRPDATYSFRAPTADDLAIASNLGDFLLSEVDRSSVFDEEVHLQFGVGSLGNALMGQLQDLPLADREVVYFGEVFQDGLLDMIDAGLLRSASATSLALTDAGRTRLFEGLDEYADTITLRPADISNNPGLISRFGVIAVNSAIEVDMYGNVNSTHVRGERMINGIGGSADFNRNALVTVCALPSMLAGTTVSRIVPMALHVDHTEHDLDVVITEQGVADLRGRAPLERAQAIIDSCAHPTVRDRLDAYLDSVTARDGHIVHDVEAAARFNA